MIPVTRVAKLRRLEVAGKQRYNFCLFHPTVCEPILDKIKTYTVLSAQQAKQKKVIPLLTCYNL